MIVRELLSQYFPLRHGISHLGRSFVGFVGLAARVQSVGFCPELVVARNSELPLEEFTTHVARPTIHMKQCYQSRIYVSCPLRPVTQSSLPLLLLLLMMMIMMIMIVSLWLFMR